MEAQRPKVVEQDGKFCLALITPYGHIFARHNRLFGSYSSALRFLESGNWKQKERIGCGKAVANGLCSECESKLVVLEKAFANIGQKLELVEVRVKKK